MTKLYLLVKRFLPVLFLAACSSGVFAQGVAVSGKVTSSDDGSGAPGVNILIKGTNTGTVTDSDGNYRITAPQDAVLVFSFVGYTTQEVAVSSRSTIDVVLQADVTSLQEIVVVGYGEVQKKDLTGAVVNMGVRDFNKGVIASPQDLIVGKFAGVAVTPGSGAPGSAATIRVRGGASLNASNDPLIVVDGFPIENPPGGQNQAGVSNILQSINPNDIETFTVLKDASATAIYGSRASNGVVIITTKKGKEGKPQFTYNLTASMNEPVKYVDVLTGDQYRALVTDAGVISKVPTLTPNLPRLGTANTDWQRAIFATSYSQDHNLGVSGTYKKMPYRISLGFTDQEGILKTTSMQRQSLNINLSPTLLDDHLKLNVSLKGSIIDNNFGEAGAVGNAVGFDPTQSIYDPAAPQFGGYFSWLSKGATSGTSNPVAQLMQTDNRSTANRIIANALAEYKVHFLPELKISLNVGLDRSTADGHNRVPLTGAFTAPGSTTQPLGRNTNYFSRNQSELLDIYATYAKEMGDHKGELTAGYGWQHFYRDNTNITEDLANPKQTVQSASQNYLLSFFGRFNYSFKGKYLLTATLRNDGSSRFGPNQRWGLFPSVALGWRLKDEAFLSGATVLSDLKLRAGIGTTGQQDIGTNVYPYLSTYQISDLKAQYQLGNTFYQTQRPSGYDSNIKWEETTTYNIGVDFGFMEDRFTGSVEIFQKNTKDLLNQVQVPAGSNFSNLLFTNVGSLEVKGIELTLKAIAIQSKDLRWDIGFNYTSLTNKITKLNLTDDPNYTGVYTGGVGVGANIQNSQVGYPKEAFYTFKQAYGTDGKPIEGLYADLSGQGGVVSQNEKNKYRGKTANPDFLIGINTRLTYKDFDFSFSGRLSVGNYAYNNVESGRAFYNGLTTLLYLQNIPRMVTDANFTSQQIYSDYYVQNASFFKMDNISAGYKLDQLLKNTKLKARISLTVQNAFIVTNYKGIDPEVTIDNNIYPRPRTVLLGVNLTF